MARKTNKTAHVLNLLSGNGAQKNTKPEPEPEETVLEKATPTVSNITMDTKNSEDAVSDLIHQQLLSAFMEEDALKPEEEPEAESIQESEADPIAAPEEIQAIHSEEASGIPLEEGSEFPVKESLEKTPEKTVEEAPAVISEESAESSNNIGEKEPEFVVLNVIEQIVRDKIIYFMRQFDVCTCERCLADTVALTLNGLKPKYLVTPPAAVSPLISFYTNKYISDITVEATKACMTVKENPRHQKTDETP